MMINRRVIVRGLAVTGALPLASCFGGERVTRRIRVIATARVDGKMVEGSSVYELTWRASGERMYESIEGEATVLELAGRGTVFVMSAQYSKDGLVSVNELHGGLQFALGMYATAKRAELPRIATIKGRYTFMGLNGKPNPPLIVAFKDEQEFRSVYRVEPKEFSEYFGAGVEFVSVDFEFTDDEITKGVLIKRLPMLQQPAKDIPVELSREPDGRPLSYVNTPFEYKIGPNDFFPRGKG